MLVNLALVALTVLAGVQAGDLTGPLRQDGRHNAVLKARHAAIGDSSFEARPTYENTTHALERRGLPSNLGLNDANLKKNGIYFGFLPAWGEPKFPSTATNMNKILPKPMAIVGGYAQIKVGDTKFSQIDTYTNDLLKQPSPKPVLALALMPDAGLSSVTQKVADNIAKKMLEINNKGVVVWLRYAHEMNGNWYKWGQQPDAFIKSWKMVATAVHKTAPKTFMMWAPNSLFANDGKVSNPAGGYTPYWPGKSYVDIVGLSFYHYGGYERKNIMPEANAALNKIKQFDQLYGSAQGLPVVLAETGAAYTKNLQTGEPAPGGANEADIKLNWLKQITASSLKSAVPAYKALAWFDVIKDENASGNSIVKEEDFRILSGNPRVVANTKTYLK